MENGDSSEKYRDVPYDLAVSLLGIYPKQSYLHFQVDAPFMEEKIWNQPTSPSRDDWRKTMFTRVWFML